MTTQVRRPWPMSVVVPRLTPTLAVFAVLAACARRTATPLDAPAILPAGSPATTPKPGVASGDGGNQSGAPPPPQRVPPAARE